MIVQVRVLFGALMIRSLIVITDSKKKYERIKEKSRDRVAKLGSIQT